MTNPIVSIVPSLIDELFTRANDSKGQPDGIPGNVTVTDGPGVTGNPGSRLIIGGDDPDEPTVTVSSGQQNWAHATGTGRDEEGDLTCTAMAWNGDGGSDEAQKKARDDVYAIAAAMVGICVASYNLGGLDGLLWVAFGGQIDLTYRLNQDGVTAVLVFGIHYKARL